METAEFTASLRQLADWYDLHPEVPLPGIRGRNLTIAIPAANAANMAIIARAFGSAKKEMDSLFFRLIKTFGVIDLDAFEFRDKICTRRVVKSEPIIEQVPVYGEPIRYEATPRLIEEVAWDCPDSILQGGVSDAE